MGSSDRDAESGDDVGSHSWGNARGGANGFSLGHFGTIVAASLCTGLVMRFIDHSDTTANAITNAAGMA